MHESEASLSLTAPLCQSLFQRLSVNVSLCSVVYSDVAAVSLLNEIKATSTVFQNVVLCFVLFFCNLTSHNTYT